MNDRRRTPGALPLVQRRERETRGRRILDPGSGYITDWINRHTLALYPFVVGITAQQAIPANPLRTYVIIQNNSGGIIFVNFGQKPTVANAIRIPAGGNYELAGGATGGAFSPHNTVNILGSAAGLIGVVGEGVWTPEAL